MSGLPSSFLKSSDIRDMMSNSDCLSYLISHQILSDDEGVINPAKICQVIADTSKKEFLINALRICQKYSLASLLDDARQIKTKSKGRKTGEISVVIKLKTGTNDSHPDVENASDVTHNYFLEVYDGNCPIVARDENLCAPTAYYTTLEKTNNTLNKPKKKSFLKKFFKFFSFIKRLRGRSKKKKLQRDNNDPPQVDTKLHESPLNNISAKPLKSVKRRTSLTGENPDMGDCLHRTHSLDNLDNSLGKFDLEDLRSTIFDRVVQFLEEELSCLLYEVLVESGSCLKLVVICTKLEYLDKLWTFHVTGDLSDAIMQCLEGIFDGRQYEVSLEKEEYEEARVELADK